MAVSVVSFLFSRAAEPEPWSPLCWVLAFLLSLSHLVLLHLQLYSTVLLLFNSSALYYLQTPMRCYGHTSAISSDIWRSGCVTSTIFGMACVIVIEWKYLSCSSEVTLCRCVSLREYNGIFFLPRPISSANFRPRDFLS